MVPSLFAVIPVYLEVVQLPNVHTCAKERGIVHGSRHNPDDCLRQAVESQSLSERLWVFAKSLLPIGIAEDDNLSVTRFVIQCESAPHGGRDTHDLEIVCADGYCGRAFGDLPWNQKTPHWIHGKGRHMLEDRILLSLVHKISRGLRRHHI